MEIVENRGNAVIYLAKIIAERDDIKSIGEIHGGDADNAIPRNAHAKVLFTGIHEELEIREKTQNDKVEITIEETQHSGDFYEKHILHSISQI